MPRNDLKTLYSEYPIPFVSNGNKYITSAFADCGFAYTAPRTRKIRDQIIGHNLLLGMYRPVHRKVTPNQAFLHPAYTRAALAVLPKVTDPPYNNRIKEWMPVATARLREFAQQPEAGQLAVEGVVKYYTQIAQAATHIEGSDHPYLAAYARSGQAAAPIEYVGVHQRSSIRGVPDASLGETPDIERRGHNSVYHLLRPMMRAVTWVIPGIDTPQIQQAIQEGLAASQEDLASTHPLIAPGELFALGRLAVAGEHGQRDIAVRDLLAV
jgi:hypothetical protein